MKWFMIQLHFCPISYSETTSLWDLHIDPASKIKSCPYGPKYELPTSMPQLVPEPNDNQRGGEKRGYRSMEDVTCFKVIYSNSF